MASMILECEISYLCEIVPGKVPNPDNLIMQQGLFASTPPREFVGQDGDQAAEHDVAENYFGHDQDGGRDGFRNNIAESQGGEGDYAVVDHRDEAPERWIFWKMCNVKGFGAENIKKASKKNR